MSLTTVVVNAIALLVPSAGFLRVPEKAKG